MSPPSWIRNPSGRAAAPPSPAHPNFAVSSLKALLSDDSHEPSSSSPRSSIFHRVRIATSTLRAWRSLSSLASSSPNPPEKRIVLYFTTLRIVRKTFDDCRTVRSILRGLRVAVDERDVSMDSRFLDELKGILRRRKVELPAVFIGGRYAGGAEEIRRLHESGELRRRVEGVPLAAAAACEGCGGIGFVLCQSCDGSHKCYCEKGGFRCCAFCNENGLVRCPECRPNESV